MKALREEVRDWAGDWFGRPLISESAGDLLHHHEWWGDDASEFIEGFAKRFDVDMTGFVWWFHYPDEGELLMPSMPWLSPSRTVTRIPISLDLLTEAALSRRWPVSYPPHASEPPALERRDAVVRASLLLTAVTIGALLPLVLSSGS